MDSAEFHALQIGDLEDREDRLDVLLNRAGEGDASAAATLRAVVSDYRNFHPSVYGRAMNRAGTFVDASLAAPLLAALADQAYGCQAWAEWVAARCASTLQCPSSAPFSTQPTG